MSVLDAAITTPRIISVSLEARGAVVYLRELTLAEAWPYIQGEGVDPAIILRQSLCTPDGAPALEADASLPLAVALELLPKVLKLNGLTPEDASIADDVAEAETVLSRVGSRG